MTWLIDGHNLINAIPDIDIDDPHDEAKLVEKLKSFCGRTGKRCTVIFDHGLPGGLSRDLSTSQVKVIFAAAYRTNADHLLRQRIRKARNPQQYTLVSSDHEVRDVALAKRMPVMTSDEFADLMFEKMAPAQAEDAVNDDVHLSASEVGEWMRIFGLDEED